jgi:ribosome biogenesis protein ENP2
MSSFASSINGVSIYNLAASKSFPQFMTAEARKARSKVDESFRRRIELLQDFSFPEASRTIATSADGRFVVATGTYPPRVRVFDTSELSMKFERYMDATPVSCCLLSDDFTKLAFLLDDRNIELHAAYGKHHRTRIPRAGRHMVYHSPTAELLVAAQGSEVFRLNLEEGRFFAPLVSEAPAVNKVVVSRVTALIGLACEGGTCEFFDPRSNERASILKLPDFASSSTAVPAATCLAFEEGGMGFAAGTSDGRCLLYDLRTTRPLISRTHPYGVPLVDVRFHRGGAAKGAAGTDHNGRLVISTDSKQCRMWYKESSATSAFRGGSGGVGSSGNSGKGNAGRLFTVIEAPATINDITLVSDEPDVGGVDSGLILLAGETERVMSYYIPQLGLAPKWCSFLDAITEELEEGLSAAAVNAAASSSSSLLSASFAPSAAATAAAETASSVFDDYKFVTREELQQLGLLHLIGTSNLLRAYMHGFLIDASLHARVRSVLDPEAIDRVRRERVRASMEAERSSRIVLDEGSLPKVNRELAIRLREEAEKRRAGVVDPSDKTSTMSKLMKKKKKNKTLAEHREEDKVEGGEDDDDNTKRDSKPQTDSGLVDERFSKLFTDADFTIDQEQEDEIKVRRGGKSTFSALSSSSSSSSSFKKRRARE